MSNGETNASLIHAAVAGSSRLFARLGTTEATHAVERCMKRMVRGIDGFHGRLVRSARDELSALFDNANDACQAAIAMQRRVADLPPVSGVQLAIRVGVHHGAVVEHEGEVFGDAVRVAESLAGLAGAGQLVTSGETQALLTPQLQSLTRRLEGRPDTELPGDGTAFEVIWAEPRAEPRHPVVEKSQSPRERELRLCIRYGHYVKLLDRHRPSVAMGRDAGCEITVHNRRASRQHARIERRGGHFVLIDLSTNGTFVTVSGEQELFIRHEQFVLRGSGVISFAASAASAAADIAEYEHL
ncbi:MAG: adenylate/guanylate cyclase domain-containing protein [Candidatus Accumulibacter sp.]|uniref:adenylate/guanylate cyclase domain-containing protein n=1 Tax=Accumulibacter sp. TaxID=2053492 RepID=UPI0004B0B39C|nr:adenylate/guanylate cyclase domain-containing protein [Accumulibacter sp.]MBL8392131.1 adenylate/guanylate cyclase domain-containing protein [Accumulibacter sp.]HRD87001.1 adenylate/guanylate cyclase domain-containing protein [Accumulibacter sp.]